MKVVKSEVNYITSTPNLLETIEYMGRICYASEPKENSCEKFIKNLIKLGHESVLEHGYVSFELISTRDILAQITRHRIANFCVQSQRFCNYSKDKFDNSINFIKPYDIEENSDEYHLWYNSCSYAENTYMKLLKNGLKPETARSVLPNSTVTNIGITANIREWRHILKERYINKNAQIDMRECMKNIYLWFFDKYPCLVEDLRFES